MRAELRASLEGLMEDYGRRIERLRKMQQDLREVGATAKSKDGLVTVVVGPRGRVQDITLDPRVYRRLSTSELSQTIMSLIGEATSDVADQMQKIMAPFMPEGMAFDEVLGEKGDLTMLLPQPPAVAGHGRAEEEA